MARLQLRFHLRDQWEEVAGGLSRGCHYDKFEYWWWSLGSLQCAVAVQARGLHCASWPHCEQHFSWLGLNVCRFCCCETSRSLAHRNDWGRGFTCDKQEACEEGVGGRPSWCNRGTWISRHLGSPCSSHFRRFSVGGWA